ncbi:MAG: sugar-binding domain-containing protein [Clostridia bacterium]
MFPDEKKITRLTNVARMYYEQDMSQSEVAKVIGVSRPMVSKLLTEAKALGIVTIKINQVKSLKQMLQERLINQFNLKNVTIIETTGIGIGEIDTKIATSTFENYVAKKDVKLGIGCGSMLGALCENLENNEVKSSAYQGEVFPLIGGLKASYRSYHTNELVRSFEENTGLTASYFYLPALVDTVEEKNFFKKTDLYLDTARHWQDMNTAFVNISNLYSTPDLATSIRFGKRLARQRAVGRFLAYYYDVQGNLIEPVQDNVMQIEIEQLRKTKNVVAICSSKADPLSVIGALRTGIFTNVILSEVLAGKILEVIDV